MNNEGFKDWLRVHGIQYEDVLGMYIEIFKSETSKYRVWIEAEKMAVPDGAMILGTDNILTELLCTCERVIKPIAVTSDIRQQFIDVYNLNKGTMYDCTLVVAIHLPTGATEIITNNYEIESKMKYYIDTYDNEFKLKANCKVQLIGFMLV